MNPENHPQTRDIIAIDVSKSSLRVHSRKERFETTNDKAGHARLIELAGTMRAPLIVCEPSGGYERRLLSAARARSVPAILADASQARHFALSQGQKAKSDPIDAEMLYAFAGQRKLQPRALPSATAAQMAELLDRRAQLSEQAASEKARLDKCPKSVAASVKRHVAYLQREMARLESALAKLTAGCQRASAVFAALTEVKGVGRITAWSVIGYLPEIGSVSRARLASLAGLAPFVRQSGKWQGQRRVGGGRSKIRDPLFMAAASARLHNEVIRSFFDRLSAKGKPYKVCLTAAMRKLLIHLQSIVKKVESKLA